MEFSIIYWNIWLDNQKSGEQRSAPLLAGLRSVLEDYRPDCIGMNEVLRKAGSKGLPSVLRYVKELGYPHVYYMPSGYWAEGWEFGSAIASKRPVTSVEGIVLGDHFTREGRTKTGEQSEALLATISLGRRRLPVVVAHLLHLRPETLAEHRRYSGRLTAWVDGRAPGEAFVIGGDFNEFKRMPLSFKGQNRRRLRSRTGTYADPTWHYLAREGWPLRANPDKIFWPRQSRMRLAEFKVIPEDVSDHRPLYAKFILGADS